MSEKSEHEDAPASPNLGRVLAWGLVVALCLYPLPLAAVYMDEAVLKTFWFSHHLPHWVGDVLRTMYPFMVHK